MHFSKVIGQQTIKQQLINTVLENRISHALLFSGPEGSGKLPMALALAQFINCTNKQKEDSCGKCSSCKKFEKYIHPDLHFVFPVVKSSSKPNPVSDTYIDQWRNQILSTPYFNLNQWFALIGAEKGQGLIYSQESGEILKKLTLKSFEGEYKIMVVWHPEKMNTVAANKLLKLIEEPPSKTIFIMVSDHPAEILETILSRTQQIRFPRLEDDEIALALEKQEVVEKQAANATAKLANGNYIQAIEIANQSEELNYFFNTFVSLMRLTYGRKFFDLLDWVDEITSQSKERQKNFLTYAIRMLRENYVMNLKQPSLVYLTPEEETFSSRFSPFINDRNVLQMAEELSLAHSHIEQNGNVRIIYTDLVLKLTILLKE